MQQQPLTGNAKAAATKAMLRAAEFNTERFSHWLDSALPGESFAYWEGFLAQSRSGEPALSMGDMAWRAHLAGRVFLVQRRAGPGHYIYLAIRKSFTRPMRQHQSATETITNEQAQQGD